MGLARSRFEGERARALLAGLAAHSMLPLGRPHGGVRARARRSARTRSAGRSPRGGSQRLADALAAYLRSLGGEIETGRRVESLAELPAARACCSTSRRASCSRMAGDRAAPSLPAALARYRYGPGRVQGRLGARRADPVGARPRSPRAGTVHLGGTLDEIAAAEDAVGGGEHPERPFVLLVQPSLFDPSRAPGGQAHRLGVLPRPERLDVDMTAAIEAQVERFAPGFRDRDPGPLAMGPADGRAHNANYVGGDINGGVQDLRQLFTRPVARLDPYSTPEPGLLHLLVVDAARRRRPRHVRLLGGAVGTGPRRLGLGSPAGAGFVTGPSLSCGA